jgi:hypothetical protein
MRWPDCLSFYPTHDGFLQGMMVMILGFILIQHSTLFEKGYHMNLTYLSTYPWWRFLVVFLILAALSWCPRVGILVAFIGFLYLSDMNTLVEPLGQ